VQPEKPKGWHTPPTFRFYPEFFELPDDTYLDGHFQAEQFFAPVAGLLRLQFSFRYDPPPHLTPLVREIEACPRSVAMHFRRGDYAVDPRYSTQNGVLTLDYYERAVDEFQERLGDFTLYIFSDDIEAIAQEFRPSIPHHFVKEVQPWHSFDEIRLMSLCEHIVMANSTFSWWAAWLNSSPEKIVIAPAPWFLGGIHNDSDVIPASWLKLAR
jgi:hypothetical protein